MEDPKEKEIVEELKGMTDSQIKDHYSAMAMKKYSRLNFAFVRIGMLLDYLFLKR